MEESIYDCPLCRDTEWIYDKVKDEVSPCVCAAVKRSKRLLKASGLERLSAIYTFDRYQHQEPWQQDIYNQAQAFIAHPVGWFYIGGQPGCGKTHICTAIASSFLEQGLSTRYMLWRDESLKLKSLINDYDYHSRVDKLKKVKVLYIDDFLKTVQGKSPTDSDIMLAFEILNSRYNNNLITIISSERFVDDIYYELDEALGRRILEKAKEGQIVNVKADRSKNISLR